MLDSVQFNVRTAGAMRQKPAAAYEAVRIDSIDDCNLRCVYCHVPRSRGLLDLGEFREFCATRVLSANQLQFGCVMEPTLDPRLCDFIEAASSSPARPARTFRLQTNGILLHRHDHDRMLAAGLNLLSLSIDSANPDTHRRLRDGASLKKIQRNLVQFRQNCPSVAVKFVVTVTAMNIDEIDDLMRWGLDLGVRQFELRQMFHYPDSPIVDHARMRDLEVSDTAFALMRERLVGAFGDSVRFNTHGASTLQQTARAVEAASTKVAQAARISASGD